MHEIEFAELRGDPALAHDEVRLAGRCYRGPLSRGDTFTEASIAGHVHAVSLRINSLLFYGKNVDSLHEGETAEVALAGKGAERVIPGVVLRGRSRSPKDDDGPQ
jgi:hypothetical protein